MSELPDGWTYTTIGDLCDLVNGRAFKPSDWTPSGLPIVRIQNLNRSDAKFNFFAGAVQEKFLVEPGDLLFGWSGTPGTSFGAHIWEGPKAILNQHIFNVHYNGQAVDKAFFRYAINQSLMSKSRKRMAELGCVTSPRVSLKKRLWRFLRSPNSGELWRKSTACPQNPNALAIILTTFRA
jgi:type I restriction enzyme S subunit